MENEKLITDEEAKKEKIRVGIIGLGFWAKYGHIPALQALAADFEIVAVTSRKKATAEAYAAQFNILHAFGNEQELISHPDVDLVVILAPGPEHYLLAKAAIAAGKDVYSEWPLTTKTSDYAGNQFLYSYFR
jgi:predicted dehydrogenase